MIGVKFCNDKIIKITLNAAVVSADTTLLILYVGGVLLNVLYIICRI